MPSAQNFLYYFSGFEEVVRTELEPDLVEALTATGHVHQIILTWQHPNYIGQGDQIVQAQVRYRAQGLTAYSNMGLDGDVLSFHFDGSFLASRPEARREGVWEFRVRLRNDAGHWGNWANVSGQLLAMPAQTIWVLIPNTGGVSARITTGADADIELGQLEIQVRVFGATTWDAADLVATTLSNYIENSDGTSVSVTIDGLDPSTVYQTRVRRVVKESGTVWREGAWSSPSPFTTNALPVLTGVNETQVDRGFRITGNFDNFAAFTDNDNWEVEISIENGAWQSIGTENVAVNVGSETFIVGTADVPLTGGTIRARIRYVGPSWQTDWVLTGTETFSNDTPFFSLFNETATGRTWVLELNCHNFVQSVSEVPSDYEFEYRVANQVPEASWVTLAVDTVVENLIDPNTLQCDLTVTTNSVPDAGGTFDWRLRYVGEGGPSRYLTGGPTTFPDVS